MEPVGAWSPAQAAAWLRGLDAAVQGYPFEAWGLPGAEVLRLSAGALEALGVRRLGHQELLLEAVEQLRALDEELASTSLRTLTEELRALACRAQALAPGEQCPGAAPQPPSLDLLACVVELVGAAKALFCWLNRYLFSTLNDYSASRDIVFLCAELVETLQEDCPAAERSGRILPICQHIVGICESIVGCSPAALLDRTAVLQRVALPAGAPVSAVLVSAPAPPSPRCPPHGPLRRPPPQDLEITSTSSGLHFIAGTASEALAVHGPPLLPGDEIVQVNEQVVVGWTPANLAKKLLEEPSGASLVLKKIPLSVPSSPGAAGQPVSRPSTPSTAPAPDWEGACSDAADPSGAGSSERPGSPASLSSSAAADWESGPDSAPDLATDEEDEREAGLPGEDARDLPRGLGDGRERRESVQSASSFSVRDTEPSRGVDARQLGGSRDGGGWSAPGSLSAGALEDEALAAAASPADPGPPAAPGGQGTEPSRLPGEGSPGTCRRPKGVATRLSRRRVSCRDLGRVDCDGWLLKKKDHVGFMAQKWKRCWFVLKGHTLYWYSHPSDEKAAGLINVATYDLESTREQKKKYVFQLSHEKYKPFIFAAETLADLSMWVSHLITAKSKFTLANQSLPHREEDCYSETEAEDPDDDSPRQGCDTPKRRLHSAPEKTQLFPASGEPSSAASSPRGSPRPRSPMDSSGEDLESLMQCLKQGGVSLIGRQRFLTEEQCRKSFVKRNKNPLINEKVHLVRALQSTLKAKLTELQVLEQLLSDAALTSEKFTSWKEEHQDLYQELREWWVRRQGQDLDAGLGAESSPLQEAAEP
ncbi:connector enhancer of kinase suppressor of ras 1 isoform X1 [Dromaius novaehollandiae]|uniref:connector enhancer of kinase suppressor of ras 1 isoform X1 n=1 Tax=Dromaius novaehollandiae TaxID=8790 RepID=UPI00311D6C2F